MSYSLSSELTKDLFMPAAEVSHYFMDALKVFPEILCAFRRVTPSSFLVVLCPQAIFLGSISSFFSAVRISVNLTRMVTLLGKVYHFYIIYKKHKIRNAWVEKSSVQETDTTL